MPFKNDNGLETYKQYCLTTVEINNHNVIIDGRNFFDQPLISGLKTYDNIREISTDQGDGNTIMCLLDYTYFTKYYKLIAIDLCKRQKLDADPKAIQQINFTGNLSRTEGSTIMQSKA